ncbi:cytochrome P450 [Actinomadura fulvescens]|uniref:Cytochrome P450 n=1 Tax=Actinomadura fulvescens TaxID=46160 RepID=A0ABN3PYV5_9ACTN
MSEQTHAGIEAFMPFNPLDPEFAANPYPHFQRLQHDSPVVRTPAGIWYVTRYHDVAAVLRDARFGHGDGTVEEEKLGWLGTASGASGEKVRSFFALDPPDHDRLRRMVTKGFSARRVQLLEEQVQRVVDELLDEALRKDEIDVMAELAYPLPVIVICELLGVPPGDREVFHGWSEALARGLDPDFVQTPRDIQARGKALLEFRDYFLDLSAARRKEPGEDLISALIQVEEEGDMLSETELLTTCVLMVIAGAETTVNFLGNSTLALLRHPDQRALMTDRPEEFPAAMEELLRYDPPVQMTFRVALEDVELRGEHIAKNDLVIVVMGAANRDPEVFDDPDRLDLTRPVGRHLAFGLGTHFCFGAPLARLQGRLLLPDLFRRAPGITLVEDKVTYKRNVLLRGLSALPVRLR